MNQGIVAIVAIIGAHIVALYAIAKQGRRNGN